MYVGVLSFETLRIHEKITPIEIELFSIKSSETHYKLVKRERGQGEDELF